MRYLLDVNALVALGLLELEFHDRVALWVMSPRSREESAITTCAITELGFVRVLSQVAQYGLTVGQSKGLLVKLKAQGAVPFEFIADDHDVSQLPGWVKTGRQTTDGHLTQLARAHDAVLAALDERMPGAFVIPG